MIRGSLYQFLNKLNETKREITRIRIKGIFKTKPLSKKLCDLRELNVLFFYNLEIFGVYGKIYYQEFINFKNIICIEKDVKEDK